MILILGTGTENNTLQIRSEDGDIKFSNEWPASHQLSEELPGMIADALQSLEKDFKDITGVVGFQGPGSYTGLRIGLTVINAIADQVGAPIVGTQEDKWIEDGLTKLNDGQNDKIILPFYGGEANITKPRK